MIEDGLDCSEDAYETRNRLIMSRAVGLLVRSIARRSLNQMKKKVPPPLTIMTATAIKLFVFLNGIRATSSIGRAAGS